MSDQKPKLTIDTNLINSKQRLADMNMLERWRDEGKLEFIGTQRLKREIAAYKNPAASAKEASIPNISEPLVWGVGNWNEGNWADEDDTPEFLDVAKVLFPAIAPEALNENQQSDVMHLLAHVTAKADVFVTNNTKDFVNDGRREQLKTKFQITVMTAEEVVTDLSSKNGWS